MSSPKSKSLAILAVMACIAALTLVTQRRTGLDDATVSTTPLDEATTTTSWNACLQQLSKLKPKISNSQSLRTMYPISNDAFISGERGTLTMNVISSSEQQKARSKMLSKLTQTIKSSSTHKSLTLGNKGHIIFPDNTIVSADIPSCTIVSAHLPQQTGKVHPDMIESIQKNKHLIREDKKKKAPPPPPPSRPNIPCTIKGTPSGCQRRILPWDQIKNHAACKSLATLVDKNSQRCVNFGNGDRIRSNLCNGKQYCVRFTAGKNGPAYGIIMQAGESWGTNPINNLNYDCNGRCGGGCGKKWICSNWSRGCMRHDVCSWYFGGGATLTQRLWLDKNCGDETTNAFKDWKNCCLKVCPGLCKGPSAQPLSC